MIIVPIFLSPFLSLLFLSLFLFLIFPSHSLTFSLSLLSLSLLSLSLSLSTPLPPSCFSLPSGHYALSTANTNAVLDPLSKIISNADLICDLQPSAPVRRHNIVTAL